MRIAFETADRPDGLRFERAPGLVVCVQHDHVVAAANVVEDERLHVLPSHAAPISHARGERI